LEERYGGPEVSEKMRRQRGWDVSCDDVIAALQKVAAAIEPGPLTTRRFESLSSISLHVVRSRFGSWQKALEAAGIVGSARGRRYSDEECHENLFAVWVAKGRAPQYRDMADFPSVVGGKAYVLRWGTWLTALEAFVERVSSAEGDTSAASEGRVADSDQAVEVASVRPRRREVPLSVRFAVLKRDNFTCRSCGRSPATHLGVTLHVDHVVAVVNGGTNDPRNLQSLCDDCNLGKGTQSWDDSGQDPGREAAREVGEGSDCEPP